MFGESLKVKSSRVPRRLHHSLFRNVFHRYFKKMDLGSLTFVMPEGERIIYGLGHTMGKNDIHAEIRVIKEDFFKKCVLYGDIGFGESYVDGDWVTEDITKVISWMILNVENHPTLMSDRIKHSPAFILRFIDRVSHSFKRNSLQGSQKNIFAHYDLGNEFYKLFLDPTMTYSSAYFRHADYTLEEAQKAKYDELCRKISLRAADHVLEIGSGWGGFAVHAAKNYGCRVTSLTISKAQYEFATKRIEQEKLTDRVQVFLQDYRLTQGVFDKIVSIEMVEAVGHHYLRTFFRQCHRLLKRDGILGLQMIISPDHRYESFRKNVDWIQKHIFPGSLLPSLDIIHRSIRKTGTLCLFDLKDLTQDYARTLRLWRENFNDRIEKIHSIGFDEAFIKKWNYYLSYCEAAFAMRNIAVVQAAYSRPNNLSIA